MNSVYEVRQRVLRERLEEMAAAAERAGNENELRLALCCLALLERHRVDGKGHCRHCRRASMWWPCGVQRCSVLSVVGFYWQQPMKALIRARI